MLFPSNGPDSAVQTYAHLLGKVHALIAQGLGDSPQAEALADEMDALWFAMTDEEQVRMCGLSEGLYRQAEGKTGMQEKTHPANSSSCESRISVKAGPSSSSVRTEM